MLLSAFPVPGCKKADVPPVGFEIVPGSVTRTGLTCRITRGTESCTFGGDYALEREENGGWVPVPYADTADMFAFNAVEHVLAGPNVEKEISAGWELLYGALEDGHYRICKRFGYAVSAAEEEITLYAEFDVPEP